METDEVYLSKTDAQAVFGFTEYNSLRVLRYWQSLLTSETHNTLYPALKFLVIVTKVYLNYRSADVGYAIKVAINKMIADIYPHEDDKRTLKSLMFMFSIIWLHRNIEHYKILKNKEYDRNFLEQIRQQLFKLKATPTYQKKLF